MEVLIAILLAGLIYGPALMSITTRLRLEDEARARIRARYTKARRRR